MSAAKPNVVFVLGGPGAGKGTQCVNIVEEFGYMHLSAGDLLRAERNREGSEYGNEIETHIRNGTIVPIEITCKLLEIAMQTSDFEKFVIDGFPRNADNLTGWNKNMSHKVNLLFVLFFHCDEQVCVDRCMKRGEAGSGRSDDNAESLRKRIETYNSSTMPIIEHYTHMGMVRRIDASRTPEEVYSGVRTYFLEAEQSK